MAKHNEIFKFSNRLIAKCHDKDGNLKWKEDTHNLVTNGGIDNILDVMFHNSSQTATWYLGLANSGSKLATDTLASHPNWTEFSDYTGNRVAYVEGAASGQSITNSGNEAVFTITNTGTVAGCFLASASTGTVGLLFSVIDFSAVRNVLSGDTITLTYSISAADA